MKFMRPMTVLAVLAVAGCAKRDDLDVAREFYLSCRETSGAADCIAAVRHEFFLWGRDLDYVVFGEATP